MSEPEQAWIPLVDGPIGAIVDRVQKEHPEIGELIDSPNRLLAFRTFAYIRVGVLLGKLLVERDIAPYDGSETWVEQLLHGRHSPVVLCELASELGSYQRDTHEFTERLGCSKQPGWN